ncbi:hypothetical protein PIB30_097173 [Stylosanthes scabra]|uniref:Aminotransferase-like plant mobile domain-containing protein n=1 Tax=Stylosanthes scabra TaxID=79078 RepID=A0ABU6RWH8_9FABA|nr:hypothetical protein [Stylosanthes scabra]
MWAHSLIPQKLRVGAPGEGTLEMKYKLNLYSPQFVAPQFGFAQALPLPIYFKSAETSVKYEIGNTAEFDDVISLIEEKVKQYRRVPGLTRCCYSRHSFDDWWSNYFTSHCPSIEQALTNLNLTSIVQGAPVSKKTKGTHINDILSFEKFYKVKWNVMWLRPMFYSALDIWKRKKAAHEDRCFKNYLKAKQVDPLARLERFARPFKYLPFPNAQFGISDRLPDPEKGILTWDYITDPLTPHLCGVTSTPYEWCRETHHLISGLTKIEKYPPAAKLIAIKGTSFEPTKPAEDWVSDTERSPKKKKEKKGSARAKSSSTATLTSRKRNVVECSSDAEGPVTKIAHTSQPQKKLKKTEMSEKELRKPEAFIPNPATQSNMESARAILSNPAMLNRSISAGLVGVSSSQASTESTWV